MIKTINTSKNNYINSIPTLNFNIIFKEKKFNSNNIYFDKSNLLDIQNRHLLHHSSK